MKEDINAHHLSEISSRISTEKFSENIRLIYSEDELIIADNLRDLPDFRNYKFAFNIIFQCHTGEAQFDLGNHTISLHAGQVFISHSHVTIGRIMFSPDFGGGIICISDRLLKTILQAQLGIWNRALYQRHYLIFDTRQDQQGRNEVDEMIIENFRQSDSPFKQDTIVCLLRVALLMICERIMKEETTDTPKGKGVRMDIIFQRFLENLSRKKVKRVSVAQYAAELYITPKYLSTICRKISGKSPIEWISEYVVQDISVYLLTTDLSAKEIAMKMGFPNSSFFGKYVREHMGMSPSAYRQAKRNEHSQTPRSKS